MLVIIVVLIGLIKKKIIYEAIGVKYIIPPIFSNSFFKQVEGNKYRKSVRAKK
jgi:hypothetical protein